MEGEIERLLEALEGKGITAINFEQGVYVDEENNIGSLEDLNINVRIERRDGAVPSIIKKVGEVWIAVVGNEEIEVNSNNFVIKSAYPGEAKIRREKKRGEWREWMKVEDIVEGGFIMLVIVLMYFVLIKIGGDGIVESNVLLYSIGAVVVSFGFRVVTRSVNS